MKLADGRKTTIQFTEGGLLDESPDGLVVMSVDAINSSLRANPDVSLQMAVYHLGVVWEATTGAR